MAKLPTNIELRHLRYFLAAAEYGSFRKASLALAVQESSVSRRIRDLEDQLGASLFRRHNGGVHLTLAGQKFLPQARAAMKHLGDGVEDVSAIGRSESGRIRVGIFSSLASGFLCELFQAFDADRTGVHVAFSDGHPTEHIAAVRLHQLDVAFVAGTSQQAGCETMHLWSEQIFAVLPTNHHLAMYPSLTWPQLVGETFIISEQAPGREIHDFLITRISDLGRYPEIDRQNVGRDNLLSLVAIGRGLTLTSEATTSTYFSGLVYRPIAGEQLPFSAVWSQKNDNPALRRLLSMARVRRKIVKAGRSPIASTVSALSGELSQTLDPSP
ncbi:LysR family transcriptional regulator [Sphingomonas morindae]|uniref:LysR family transcriptional regulator n=1 Tax=Sphingomonas morindae TaxID=1541170 RepID=A0ABY4X3X9_9SPHN|nr:LysR family transcriptional regulator [Sphingomonas morindae]USI71552.1 LysR family transcriptional regulator [Sphingomonas morindae]